MDTYLSYGRTFQIESERFKTILKPTSFKRRLLWMRGRDLRSELKSILKSKFLKFSFRKFTPTGDSDVGDNDMLVTYRRYWWQNHYAGDFFTNPRMFVKFPRGYVTFYIPLPASLSWYLLKLNFSKKFEIIIILYNFELYNLKRCFQACNKFVSKSTSISCRFLPIKGHPKIFWIKPKIYKFFDHRNETFATSVTDVTPGVTWLVMSHSCDKSLKIKILSG